MSWGVQSNPSMVSPTCQTLGNRSTTLGNAVDYVFAQGHAGARQLAETLIRQAAAERILLDEVSRAAQLEAEREVAHLIARGSSKAVICSNASSSLRNSPPAATAVSNGESAAVGLDFIAEHSSNLPSRTYSECTQIPHATKIRSHSQEAEGGSSDESSSRASWGGLPLPDSPQPQQATCSEEPMRKPTASPTVMQPYIPSFAHARPSPLHLDESPDDRADRRDGFASLAETQLQACDLAMKIRGLKKVIEASKKEARDVCGSHRRLSDRLEKECRETTTMREDIDAFNREIRDLKVHIAEAAADNARRWASSGGSILNDQLMEAQVSC
jgi:hypothetical protein